MPSFGSGGHRGGFLRDDADTRQSSLLEADWFLAVLAYDGPQILQRLVEGDGESSVGTLDALGEDAVKGGFPGTGKQNLM